MNRRECMRRNFALMHRLDPRSRGLRATVLSFVLTMSIAAAEPPVVNEDEAKVPQYALPNPLVLANGEKVSDAGTWRTKRRPEILHLFEENVHGHSAGRPAELSCETRSRYLSVLSVIGSSSQALISSRTRPSS